MRLFILILFFIPTLSYAAAIVDVGQLQLTAETNMPSFPLIDLGQDVRRAVKAQAQLQAQPLLDSSEPLGGGLQHFLLLVTFTDKKTDRIFNEGQVAARTFNNGERKAMTIRLEAQEDQWQGILHLPTDRETLIKVGSKLPDGKKRIYRFFYDQRPVPSIPQELEPSELFNEADTFPARAN